MTLLDCERLQCVHDPPLDRHQLHRASVHILSVAVLGADKKRIIKSHYLPLISVPCLP